MGQVGRFTIPVFLTAFFLLAVEARADIELGAEVDRDSVRIADRIIYTLHITEDKDTTVVLPVDNPDFRPFDLIGMQAVDRFEEGGKTKYRLGFVIVPYATGELLTPPMPVYYTGADGVEKKVLADQIKITVEGAAPATAVDIRDIKGPIALEERPPVLSWLVWAVALTVLTAIVAAYIVWSTIRKKVAPVESLHVDSLKTALKELDMLNKDSFDDIRQYYRAVSEVVRNCILDGVKVPESGLTDGALIRIVRRKKPHGRTSDVEGFIFNCTLVRFGGYRPIPEEADDTLEEARDIVTRWLSP